MALEGVPRTVMCLLIYMRAKEPRAKKDFICVQLGFEIHSHNQKQIVGNACRK